MIGNFLWHITNLDSWQAADNALHVIYLSFPGIPFRRVVQLDISLYRGQHADHGLFGNLQIPANAAIGTLKTRRSLHQVLPPDEQPGVLGPTQSLATAEGYEVSSLPGVPRKVLVWRQLCGCVYEQRDASLLCNGHALVERNLSSRRIQLVAVRAKVLVGHQEVHHSSLPVDGPL